MAEDEPSFLKSDEYILTMNHFTIIVKRVSHSILLFAKWHPLPLQWNGDLIFWSPFLQLLKKICGTVLLNLPTCDDQRWVTYESQDKLHGSYMSYTLVITNFSTSSPNVPSWTLSQPGRSLGIKNEVIFDQLGESNSVLFPDTHL